MLTKSFPIVVLAGWLMAPVPQLAAPPAEILVLRDVTVIDATGAPPAPHMVVVIENGRILALGPLRGFRPPPRARIIEGGGRFLIPGLWDMHVHMSARAMSPVAEGPTAYRANSRYHLPLFVAWGVTGVRDMSGRLELLTAWRDSVMRGLLIGPRMVVTGFKLGSSQAAVPGAPYPLRTEADVRETVRLLRRRGADFVKVDNLPRELFGALADECRREGLTFVGHVTRTMGLAEASRVGQRSVEHLDGALLSMSTHEEVLVRRQRRQESWWMRWAFRLGLRDVARYNLGIQREILETTSPARADSLYSLLASNRTWQVPTLSGLRDVQAVREQEPFAAERQPYVPPLRGHGQPTFWAADSSMARREFTRQLEVVRDMYRAGVPILAGTDSPGTDRSPGFSLVEELDLLVRAGLPPMAALQAATREPARFLGMADSLGTIEHRKVADLVLLDADPLADIRNVHRVHAVVLRGRYLSPAELDSLRTSVRELVAVWRDSVTMKPKPGS